MQRPVFVRRRVPGSRDERGVMSPRIRSVHPDLCVDDTLAGVSAEAERTFCRLWTHLDDDGRCLDNPKLLKAALYPLHDGVTAESIDGELAELERSGVLLRYESDGKRYLSAKPAAWGRYQKPRHPQPSKYPAPPKPSRPARQSRRTPTADSGNGSADDGALCRGVVVGEGGGVGEGVELLAPAVADAPSARGRAPDPLWDALVSVMACRPQTDTERGAWNAAAKQLREAGATPEQVQSRAHRYRQQWPDVSLTVPALAKHWGSLERDEPRAPKPPPGMAALQRLAGE